ncbi:MAG: LpxI family protein [Planctomycetota bacterium]
MPDSQPSQPDDAPPVGLLCGGGDLPLTVADALSARGRRVVAVAIRGEADDAVERYADRVHWTGIARLGKWIKIFHRAGVKDMLMVGSIRKRRMFEGISSLVPDLRSMKLFYGQVTSREDHTILGAVAEEFEAEGIRVRSVVDFCPELLTEPGPLTEREPTEQQWRDIAFAWPQVKRIAGMQIGQCIVVKDLAVTAVEAIEGTDEALRRGGRLAGGGAVAVKVAREGHDPRFDIPCTGPHTVETLREAGVAVLALEAGQTIVLDPERVTDAADRAQLCIVAVTAEQVREVGR